MLFFGKNVKVFIMYFQITVLRNNCENLNDLIKLGAGKKSYN